MSSKIALAMSLLLIMGISGLSFEVRRLKASGTILTLKTKAAITIVSVSKIYNMTEPGTTFLVNITVSDVLDLNLWLINLTWDPAVIKVSQGDPDGTEPKYKPGTKYNIYEGPFLKQGGTTYFAVRDVDNDKGEITRLACALAGRLSASGSGVLATINFTLVNPGTTEICITGPSWVYPGKSNLQDSNGSEIAHKDSHGIVSDQPPAEITERVHNLDTGLNYTTIQDAIDAPETLNEHTIFVEEGIYYENVVLNKSLRLLGENMRTTIIDGDGVKHVVEVTADNVTITGFTVRNSELGIVLINVENCSIFRNNIENNWNGIGLLHSSNNDIIENNLTAGGHGIWLTYSCSNNICGNSLTSSYWDGIHLAISLNNNITANIILNNRHGIELIESMNNSITGNKIVGNIFPGVEFIDSSYNCVSGNSIEDNENGISLWNSSNNQFYHNNLINNTKQSYDGSWDHPEIPWSINAWDNGYPSGGNYWSNYNGTDFYSGPDQNVTGSDGIGDITYVLETQNVDRFPLIASINIFDAGTWNDTLCKVHIISNSTVLDFHFNETEKIMSFNVTGETGLGICRVTIPNIIIQSMWQGNYTVLVDGETPLDIRNWTDTTNTYIYFTYQHTEHEVAIVPELPSFPFLPLFIIVILLVVILHRRKQCRIH